MGIVMFDKGYWSEKHIANANEYWLKHEGAKFTNCLDIACGYRVFGSVGVDTSKDALKKTDKTRVVGSAMALPFKDGVFDETICNFLLEHLMPIEDLNVAKECLRVLKDGGKSYFVTEKFSGHFNWDYTHIHPFSVNSLKHLMKDAGFGEAVAKRSFPMIKGYNYIGRKFGEKMLFRIQRITKPILWFANENLIGVGTKK
jgi:SAM-dependent methyltransferase